MRESNRTLRKKKIFFLLSVFISGVFCYLAFRHVNFHNVFEAIKNIRWTTILVFSLFIFLYVFVKGFKWKLLVNRFDELSIKDSFLIYLIVFMFNSIFPFRSGDIIQVFLTRAKTNIEKTKILGTITVNKFFEMASFLPLILILGLFIPLAAPLRHAFNILILLTFAFVFLFAFDFIRWNDNFFQNFKILKLISNYLYSLKIIKDKELFFISFLMASLSWVVEGLMIAFLIKSFGIAVPFWATIFVLVAINVAITIPATSSNIGTFEYAVIFALTSLGIEKDRALSFALILHILEVLPVAVFGFIVYLRFHYNIIKNKATLAEPSHKVPTF